MVEEKREVGVGAKPTQIKELIREWHKVRDREMGVCAGFVSRLRLMLRDLGGRLVTPLHRYPLHS